jgi:hypothetical protein
MTLKAQISVQRPRVDARVAPQGCIVDSRTPPHVVSILPPKVRIFSEIASKSSFSTKSPLSTGSERQLPEPSPIAGFDPEAHVEFCVSESGFMI